MTKVPTPRFDLLKMRHYAFGSLQFSRGCPFQCEFCDIIVTFGRRPRIKTAAAGHRRAGGLARRRGCAIVFIVDDNLIGNKKAIKEVLRDVIAWQEANGYPLDLLHRGVDRPGRRPRADAADGRGQHRHASSSASRARTRTSLRETEEVPERPRAAARCWRRSTASRTPAWRSGAG